MTTKIGNPNFSPDVFKKVFQYYLFLYKVTLINFVITNQGLEEQLLIEIVKFERIDLEEKRKDIIIQVNLLYISNYRFKITK